MGLQNAAPSWLLEVSDLRAHPTGDSHKIGSAVCVDKFFPERRQRLDFIGVSQRENVREVPSGAFRLLERLLSAPQCILIRSWTLRQQFTK